MALSSSSQKNKAFNFELVSPTQIEVRGLEEKVIIPGYDGDFMVLPGHTRLITNLRDGIVRVIRGEQEAHVIYITGGFADIGPDHCTVLATQATPVHMLNKSDLEERLDLLRDDLPETSEEQLPDLLSEIDDIKRKLDILKELKE